MWLDTPINMAVFLLVLAGILTLLSQEVLCDGGVSERINKGEPVYYVLEHRYTARILFDNETACVGTLLNEDYVLTLASCVRDNVPLNRYTVILGDYQIRREEVSFTEQIFRVGRILPYPLFVPRPRTDNLALVRLARKPLIDDVSVFPMTNLATKREERRNMEEEEAECVMVGWGNRIINKGRLRKTLKLSTVEVDLQPDSNCEDLPGFNAREHVCYKTEKGGPCGADDGAPIMCRKRKIWVQVGFHAYSDTCKAGYKYGVSVATYRKWIRLTSEGKDTGMQSFYLTTKWRTWYALLNTNGDDVIDQEDADIAARLFARSHVLLGFPAGMALSGYRLWYNQCALNFKRESATMIEFIQEMTYHYMTDRESFRHRVDQLCMYPYFLWMDEDLDGFMTLHEFEMAFLSWNLVDEYTTTRLFNFLGPVNDVLPIETCIMFFEELLLDENPRGRSTFLRGLLIEKLRSRTGVLLNQGPLPDLPQLPPE